MYRNFVKIFPIFEVLQNGPRKARHAWLSKGCCQNWVSRTCLIETFVFPQRLVSDTKSELSKLDLLDWNDVCPDFRCEDFTQSELSMLDWWFENSQQRRMLYFSFNVYELKSDIYICGRFDWAFDNVSVFISPYIH